MSLFDDEKKPVGGRHIKGVSCDVKNCVYHDGDAYCTADRIAVGPTYANSTTDTVCATFRPKKGMTAM
ncbi:MAG: DUF1540 domain-containing protein [Clostridia bacterium]|nr:DUF1540 domain-containing protein [Clostridia bacterium]